MGGERPAELGSAGEQQARVDALCAPLRSLAVQGTSDTDLTALATCLEHVAGCVGLGLVPSGAVDPYELRQACGAIVFGPAAQSPALPMGAAFASAYDSFPAGLLKERGPTLARLHDFFDGRLRQLLHAEPDALDASLPAWDMGSLPDLSGRLGALAAWRRSEPAQSLIVNVKRAVQAIMDVEVGPVDEAALELPEERALLAARRSCARDLNAALRRAEHAAAFRALDEHLQAALEHFMQDVFVLVDSGPVRDNRLRLLASVIQTIQRLAHLHLLS